MKKLGIMISAPPQNEQFARGLEAANSGLSAGEMVFLYFIDAGVEGISLADIDGLKSRGAKVFACAYSLEERGLKNEADCTLAGLSVLSDVIASTDQFLSYN